MTQPKNLSPIEQLQIFAANKSAKKNERLNPDELAARLDGFGSARAARAYFKAGGARIDLSNRSVTTTRRREIKKARL
jgi:hypothetical protein